MTDPATLNDTLIAASARGRALETFEHDGYSTRLTYADLLERALRGAGTLTAAGLEPGDRVALVVPEVAGFIQAFFGILAAGLVPVPLVPPAQAGDISTFGRQSRQLLAASRAAAVITTKDVAPLMDLAYAARAPQLVTLDALAAGRALPAPVCVPSTSTALVQFTSG